jgi:hypothetical protein
MKFTAVGFSVVRNILFIFGSYLLGWSFSFIEKRGVGFEFGVYSTVVDPLLEESRDFKFSSSRNHHKGEWKATFL